MIYILFLQKLLTYSSQNIWQEHIQNLRLQVEEHFLPENRKKERLFRSHNKCQSIYSYLSCKKGVVHKCRHRHMKEGVNKIL